MIFLKINIENLFCTLMKIDTYLLTYLLTEKNFLLTYEQIFYVCAIHAHTLALSYIYSRFLEKNDCCSFLFFSLFFVYLSVCLTTEYKQHQ